MVGFFFAKSAFKPKIGPLSVIVVATLYLSATCFPKKESTNSVDFLLGKKLGDVVGDSVLLYDSANNIYDVSNFTGRVHLLSFYQQNCRECEINEKVIKRISNEFLKDSFRVVFIDNGATDFFENFQLGSHKDFRLFDHRGHLANQLGISVFPLDLLVDSTGVIRYVKSANDHTISPGNQQNTSERIRELVGHPPR